MKEKKNRFNLTAQEKEELDQMREKMIKRQKEEPAKLSEHLQAFNDAVIAIIMTVIVLEIKPPVNEVHYEKFLADIVVFLITFFIIGDFWYDLHISFSYFVRKPTKITVILDMLFLVDLALFPVMTEWIMKEHSTFAMINYGVVSLIAQLLKIAVEYFGSKSEFKDSLVMSIVLMRHSAWRVISIIIINIFLIILSFYKPNIAMILYLMIPLVSLIAPTRNRGVR
ncbi:TMEM175 family protein [Lactobacillus sp.]|uniref:TMEM175 family protein n=1 Tax=Lactobacillus sp. TaxID=1591 RepID=UPI00198F1180|nr:TMEM175 family protein [Lactobacillus sp.]MBD5430176.1 DUF1211 domain-containing protein [Lactobacillus sp.]